MISKLLKSFLCIFLLCSVVYGATEDFTTYTEVDSGTIITVVDASNLGYNGDVMNTDNYVYDDKGSGNFGDYDIEHEIYTNAPNSSTNQWGYVGVSNSVDDAYNWTSGQVHWCQPASASQFWMIERLTDKGNANNDVIAQHARNVRYYMKMERSGTTATLKSYTDSGRTTLEDTASITSETTTYQYIYGVSSWNVGTSGRSNSYESDNLEIIDAGVGPAPTFIPKVMFF